VAEYVDWVEEMRGKMTELVFDALDKVVEELRKVTPQ
jgi:DNA-binding SARP family transcriptional activator